MKSVFISMFALMAAASSQKPCNSNDCYRAFNGEDYTASAKLYCSKFTTFMMNSVTSLPWASKSCSQASQISSICSCAYPAGTMPPTSALQVVPITTVISPHPSFRTSTSIYKSREFGPGCLANNCLRALDRYNANAFCSVFTHGGIALTGIPAYASPCNRSTMAQVSSACTCLNNGGTMIPAPTFVAPTGNGGTSSTNGGPMTPTGNGGTLSTNGGTPLPTVALSSPIIPIVSPTLVTSTENGVSSSTNGGTPLPSGMALSTFTTTIPQPPYGGTSSSTSSPSPVGVGNPPPSPIVSSPATSAITTGIPNNIGVSSNPALITSTLTSPAGTNFSLNSYCYANNCLRALKHEGGFGASVFCSNFTRGVAVTNTAALPTYATQCSTNPIAQLSSACTCIGSQAYITS